MHGMARMSVPGEAQEDIAQAEPPITPGKLRRWRREFDGWLTAQHGGGANQGILERRVRPWEAREGEGLPSACHSHVVEPARSVHILAAANAIPASIQHNYVVELQALGAMGCRQQQPALAATYFPCPLGQPFDKVTNRSFRATRPPA